jgi:hypothetical protein
MAAATVTTPVITFFFEGMARHLSENACMNLSREVRIQGSDGDTRKPSMR